MARKWAEEIQDDKHHRRVTSPRQRTPAGSAPDRWAISQAFLGALDTAHNDLRGVARGERPGDLLAVANTVLEEAGVYTHRDQLLTAGGRQLVAAGEAAFFALVTVRNVVRTGATLESPAYHAAYHLFADHVWRYRLAVRAEFGGQPLTPGDVHRQDWSDSDRCAVCGGSVPETDRA